MCICLCVHGEVLYVQGVCECVCGGYTEEAVFGLRLKLQDEGLAPGKETSRAGTEGLFSH